ncbi:ATP-binding protein [Streptomyces sp. NPDC127084]|uniref:ATP-binding protein n=1 Tax=Streptomyces sp. NPDC127084 TaxID=3347133 RepID=UPI0036535756
MTAPRKGRPRLRLRLPSWTATLTWKAALFITVMCCALAALLGALVHASVTRETVEDARQKALIRLEEVTHAYEMGEPLGDYGALDPPGLPERLRALALSGQRGTVVSDFRGRPTMWAAGPADDEVVAVRVDYSASSETISDLDRAILGSSVLAIAATLLVGAFAVTRVSRRLHLTAQVARRISAGDLDARVNDPRTKDPSRREDEVATVSGALDTMASTLQDKLLNEQRFTADVAHELRTPLTGLSAAAELLPPGRPSELVQDRVRTMRALTEDLLEISRLDTGGETVDMDIHELVPLTERVVRAVRSTGCETELNIGGPARVRVETDQRRLERVLANLIANAHEHGARPVTVTIDGPVVTVRDHGTGYPGYLLERGPQRFRTESGGKGHGLGLTIALGQAAVIGAELVFANAPEGGAIARLTLPEYAHAGHGDVNHQHTGHPHTDPRPADHDDPAHKPVDKGPDHDATGHGTPRRDTPGSPDKGT